MKLNKMKTFNNFLRRKYTQHRAMLHICFMSFYAETDDGRNENWAKIY